MSNDFSTIIAYSGENNKILSFQADTYYYHSDANNDFTFFCEYNAPIGETNLIFPDTPCSSFDFLDAYGGESGQLTEILTSELWPAFSDEVFDFSILTFKSLSFNEASTGENASIPTILISKFLAPIGYSGEYSVFNSLYLPTRAELSIDGYADENTFFDLSASYSLSLDAYVGEYVDATLELTDYGAYILTEGPAAYWKFDEKTGTSATDSTGNNSAATIYGPTIANASPVASHYAFYFDGTNDLVTGNPTSVVSANLTQELWVKPDAGATITLYTPSLSAVQGTSGQRYAVWPRQSGTGSGGGISVGSNGIQIVAHGDYYLPILLSYQQPISTTQYTHILVSWNDRTPTLYVNGVAVATGYQARSPFNSQGLPSDGQYGYYKGYMQDVAIYTSALTADQAREHYLAGIGLHIPRFEPRPSFSGEYADADFTIDTTPVGSILNFSGEYTQAFLENHVRFYPDMVGGEYGYILDNYISIVPNSTFTHFHGLAGYSQTSTCLTLNALTSPGESAGINAYFALPFQLQNGEDITFYFKRTKPSTWFDDDFTDAGLWFCFFPNYTPAQITFATWTWGYDIPNYGLFKGAIIVRMRFSNSSAIRVNYIDAVSGTVRTNDLTIYSNWTTTETDGTDECSIVITASDSNTVIQARGKDNVVRQSGTFSNMANPFANGLSETTDTFLIHYHNYTDNNSEVLCDMRIGTQEGIVLVSFASLGISQAYSGENALIDNLRTVSLLDPSAVSGENNLLSFTTFPAPEIALSFYEGGYGVLALATVSLLDGKAYTGQYGTSTLTTAIGTTFTLIFYPGTTAEATLRTIDSLIPQAYTGQNTVATLIDYPATPLYAVAYSGEYADATILPGITFPSIAYDGAYGTFDLSYVVNTGMPAGWYDGESVEFTLSTTDALAFIGYTGENVLLYFGASFALYPNAYTGIYAQASLTLNPFDQIDSAGYNGQVIYPTLNTTTRLPNIGYAGENVLFDLQQSLQPNILLIPYSGQTAIASLQISFQLPIGRSYTGTDAVVNKIDSEPNTHFYTGTLLETS